MFVSMQKFSPLSLPALLLLVLLAAGCGGLPDHSALEQDAQECQQAGWETDTPEYEECMENLRSQRTEDKSYVPDFLRGGWWLGTWF